MSSRLLTGSPAWTAAGWTMLHMVWVGAAVGLTAAIVRRLSRSARPETRYGVALIFLLMLAISPVPIFVRVFEPESVGPEVTITRLLRDESASPASFTRPSPSANAQPAIRDLTVDQPVVVPKQSRLESLVTYVPWFWLCGSLSNVIVLATGLIGVERMRRSSQLVGSGDLAQRCRALANSLGIARRVSVGICDSLAMPVLTGIVRPLILLPSAALSGWSVEQLEMVLLHELAHLRRWDNLVNLLQRFVESLLFFHPVVWWLSGWVRLERELCCDRLVVERLGQPVAYAEMLVALSGTSGRRHRAILAMADRHVLTRIRRLFNLEERSMKVTMPEGLGLLGGLIVGVLLILASQAAQTKAVGDLDKAAHSVAEAAANDTRDTSDSATRHSDHTPEPVSPKSLRAISLDRRDSHKLTIQLLPTTSDGTVTYLCRGGIKIVCKSQKLGTIRLEADEAVIKRIDGGR